MLRGMVTLLLENGQLKTTLTRAKEVRSMTEKMITLGKKNTLASRRAALAYITKEDVVTKLFSEIAPKYESRNGGYTRILKLGNRRGDAAEMALVMLVQEEGESAAPAADEKKPAKKTAEKKPAAKKAAAKKADAPKEKAEAANADDAPKAAPKKRTAKKAAPENAEEAPAEK